jgi:hypothetical protein
MLTNSALSAWQAVSGRSMTFIRKAANAAADTCPGHMLPQLQGKQTAARTPGSR